MIFFKFNDRKEVISLTIEWEEGPSITIETGELIAYNGGEYTHCLKCTRTLLNPIEGDVVLLGSIKTVGKTQLILNISHIMPYCSGRVCRGTIAVSYSFLYQGFLKNMYDEVKKQKLLEAFLKS